MTIKVRGFRELEQALGEFKKATARSIANRALKRAAEPIAEAARTKAGRFSGKLKASIGVSPRLAKKVGSAEFAAALAGGASKQEAIGALREARRGAAGGSLTTMHVGPGQLAQAITEEFGTADQPPHPFMRPAWDGNRQAALDSIADELRLEIGKAAKRAAAKALKAKR